MNTEKIIKALECCTTGNAPLGCDECPCKAPTNSFKGSLACNDEMMKKALALIKKLTAKSEVQNKAISNLRQVCATNNLDIYRYEKKIQKQQAKIERLELEKAGAEAGARMFVEELQAQIENLKKENKYLRESLADEREHKEDMKGK